MCQWSAPFKEDLTDEAHIPVYPIGAALSFNSFSDVLVLLR